MTVGYQDSSTHCYVVKTEKVKFHNGIMLP